MCYAPSSEKGDRISVHKKYLPGNRISTLFGFVSSVFLSHTSSIASSQLMTWKWTANAIHYQYSTPLLSPPFSWSVLSHSPYQTPPTSGFVPQISMETIQEKSLDSGYHKNAAAPQDGQNSCWLYFLSPQKTCQIWIIVIRQEQSRD